LTIPLVAIVAQVSNNISVGALLGFLVVSVILFYMGRLLQSGSGQGRK
jgi:hypothetical protein